MGFDLNLIADRVFHAVLLVERRSRGERERGEEEEEEEEAKQESNK